MCNCLNPVSNRTETAVWFRNQIAIMSTMSKKLRNACRNCSLNHESAFKPKSYQLPTTAMSYNQSLSSLPPSASLADLNLFGALVSHHTSFMVPCSLNDPSRLTLLPCTEEPPRRLRIWRPNKISQHLLLSQAAPFFSGSRAPGVLARQRCGRHKKRCGDRLSTNHDGPKRKFESFENMFPNHFPTISQPFPNHFPTISQSIPKRRELSVLLWSLH